MRTFQRRTVLLLSTAVAAILAVPLAAAAAPGAEDTNGTTVRSDATQPTMWATQLQFDDHGAPWSKASFAALRAKGLNSAEIDMPWNSIEPSPGTFHFSELDQELANATAAGMRVVPIFWLSGWGGSPASWVTSHEISSTGAQSPTPAWWDTNGQSGYFTYVTDTVRHIAGEAGYGGSILDYGTLDAQWDYSQGASGWAPDDINEFHQKYLPATYGSIAKFNADNKTSYSSFAQVPAARPGQALAGVYQEFRVWSVQDTYSRLTAAVRAITSGPLYYYFGGHLANAPNYANIPDLFFAMARTYTVTIIVDAAQSPGLTLTFGSLARAYGVKIAQEWTAPSGNAEMKAQAAQWVSNYAMGLPDGGGEDFFIHDGTTKDIIGFPIYTGFLSTLQGLSGSYPQQPAAVYIDFSRAYGNAAGGNLGGVENSLTNVWEAEQAGFAVVTSQEVAGGVVKLAQYKAILPLNGVDANLNSYKASGGILLTDAAQLARYAPAYAQLSSTGSLQIVPAVAANHASASLTLAEISPTGSYNGTAVFSLTGLNLNTGSYHLVSTTGAEVPQKAEPNGDLCAAVNMTSAQLAQWNMVAGGIPAGTPAPASCPASSAPGVTIP
jgi:hypothetical protein